MAIDEQYQTPFNFQSEVPNSGNGLDFNFAQDSVVTTVPPSAEASQQRAEKWSYGLGDKSPGSQVLLDRINTGNEDDEAKIQAQSSSYQEIAMRKQIIDDMLKNKQGNITPQDINFVRTLSGQPLKDSADFFEAKYAEKVVNTAAESFLQGAVPQEPDYQDMDYAQRTIHFKEGVQKITENIEAKYKQQGLGEKIYDQAERFVPLFYNARMRDSFWALTGSNRQKQYSELLLMEDPSQALAIVKDRASKMAEGTPVGNPLAAIEWLHGLASYSSSDAALDDIFGIVGTGLAVGGAISGGRALYSGMRGLVKATGNRTTRPIDILEATGDIDKASRILAEQTIAKKSEVFTPMSVDRPINPRMNSIDELRGQTTTLQSGPSALDGNNSSLSREAAQRIINTVEANKTAFAQQLANGPIKIARLDPGSAALRVAEVEADRVTNAKNPYLADHIIDVRTSNLDEVLTSNRYRVYTVGERAGPPETRLAIDTGSKVGAKAEATPLKAANQNAPLFLPKAEQREFRKLDGLLTIAERMGKKDVAESIAGKMQVILEKYSGETKIPGAGPAKTTVREFVPANDNLGRVSFDVGAPGPKPFRTAEGAQTAADHFFKFTPGTYEIKPVANGHVITISQPIDETLPSVRNAARIETQNQNPKGILSVFRSWLPLGKDSKLAPEIMSSAKIVGYGVKGQQRFIRSLLEPVNELRKTGGSLGKKAWEDFNTFLDRQRLYRNKDDSYGKFSRDFQEFEKDWHKEFLRLPTEKEHAAYWSYVQLSDTDWVLRNLNIYRDKVRQGRELFQLPVSGAYDPVPHIEGKIIRNFPWDSNAEANFLLWNKDPSQIQKLSNRRFKKMRAEIEGKINSGEYKVIHLAEYGEDELRKTLGVGHLPEGKINYVITPEAKTSPLNFQQIPYRPGGHHAYEYEWYIRQPNLKTTGTVKKTTWYSGDTNFAGVHTERDGGNLIKHLNTARELLIEARASGNTATLEKYLNKHLPTIDLKQWDTSFKGVKGGGTLDPNTPFYLTKNGVNVDKTHDLAGIYKRANPNHEYKRTAESPHNLNNGQVNLQFSQERGDPLFAFENVGTKAQPIYNFQRAKMMDPMAIAQRASENVANSRLLDDLKIKATERYIAEFGDFLSWDPVRVRSNPMDALMNAPIKPDARLAERAAAKDARRSTLELLGIRNDNQIYIEGLQQRAYEWLSSTKLGKKAEDLTPEWLLPSIKDPTKALRQVAFHFKQGLFNIAALTNQAHIVSHIAGIEGPINTVKAGISGQYMSMLRFWEKNPAMVAKFAESQSLTGMKKEHFIEAFNGLMDSEFHRVGGEVADYNNWMKADLWESKLGTFADYGTFFYKRGEELGRYTSWAAAYNRWRAANPKAIFDSVAKAQVLARADMLNLNMSGVSNSTLQRGIPGVITQFFTAHLRQAEQIFNGSLTRREIAQLIATNSVIYGVPVGVATVMPLWPIRQSANETSMQKSWRPEDNIATDILMNGLVAAGAERLGAAKYDVGGQGLSGIQLGRDLWRGDKAPLDLLSGVSGRVFSGLFKSAYPLSQKVLNLGTYQLTRQDFADILDNISSFSDAEKIIAGVSLGKYFGKNDVRQEDITKVQAIMMGLTGLQLQSISDAYDQLGAIKDIQTGQKAFEQRYGLYVRRAFEAHEKGDLEGFNLYMDRANAQFILGNFSEQKRMTMAKRALDDHAPLVERVYKKFMETVNTPEAFESYKKRLEKRGN